VNGPSPVQPVGCWQVITTGAGIVLVAAGAILRFAVPATFIHGLDLRVAGVIVMLPGVVALLLSLLVWGPLRRRAPGLLAIAKYGSDLGSLGVKVKKG